MKPDNGRTLKSCKSSCLFNAIPVDRPPTLRGSQLLMDHIKAEERAHPAPMMTTLASLNSVVDIVEYNRSKLPRL